MTFAAAAVVAVHISDAADFPDKLHAAAYFAAGCFEIRFFLFFRQLGLVGPERSQALQTVKTHKKTSKTTPKNNTEK